MGTTMIKNAIILCAGLGSRLAPLTDLVPKPLVKVKSKPIVETIVENLIIIGVSHIFLVVGYRKEQFTYLKRKYKNIKLILNANFATQNNISSIFRARRHLQSSLIIEGDILINNPSIFEFSDEVSSYNGFFVSKTNDWCFKVDDRLSIVGFGKGGENCFQMVGVSYWNKVDGKKLSQDIRLMYANKENRGYFWDQVPLELCKENYNVKVRICSPDDASEIDTLDDLRAIDPSYST